MKQNVGLAVIWTIGALIRATHLDTENVSIYFGFCKTLIFIFTSQTDRM